jgi:Lon protease-like protein
VVQFVEDGVDEPDTKLADDARAAYADLVKRATDREPEDAELEEMGAYDMAATVDFGLDAKQGLLDLRSENARLKLVTRLFRAATKRLDFVDRAQARARSNGKVRFG